MLNSCCFPILKLFIITEAFINANICLIIIKLFGGKSISFFYNILIEKKEKRFFLFTFRKIVIIQFFVIFLQK